MAAIQPHRPVLRILAAFSRYAEAIEWAKQMAEGAWGRVALESELFDHRETNYYEATMGTIYVKNLHRKSKTPRRGNATRGEH